jgi:hypothetical protein
MVGSINLSSFNANVGEGDSDCLRFSYLFPEVYVNCISDTRLVELMRLNNNC